MFAKWSKPYRGDIISGDEIDRIPNCPALYLWKRVLRRSPESALGSEQFNIWIEHSLSSPFFRSSEISLKTSKGVNQLTIRPHFIKFGMLEIGGGEISDRKIEDLASLEKKPEQIENLYLLLHDAADSFGPVFYVGETDKLRNRVKMHININSSLQQRLNEIGLNLEDVAIRYVDMSEYSEAFRKVAEQILTHLFLAPYSFRAG